MVGVSAFVMVIGAGALAMWRWLTCVPGDGEGLPLSFTCQDIEEFDVIDSLHSI